MKDAQAKFFNDERYLRLSHEVDDIRIGDIDVHAAHVIWKDAPEDFVEWLVDSFDSTYSNLVVIHEVMHEYIMDTEEDHDFTQEELDELFTYAETTPVKAFFPERQCINS